ncbi:STAS domain-containing protein [Streptomyces sp. NPDC016845]|uniref:STAS domain-containing protein n=1 Tax=Streptomyces sp. NPDC016845 TaxID=3364972 RepID=UPI00378A11FB
MGTPFPPGLQIQTVDTGDTVLLHLRGELDIATAPRLEPVLIPLTAQTCELDLGHVTFIDSTGINLLTRHHRQAAAAGGRLRLIAATRAVRRVLEITGTTYLLDDPGPPPPDTLGH